MRDEGGSVRDEDGRRDEGGSVRYVHMCKSVWPWVSIQHSDKVCPWWLTCNLPGLQSARYSGCVYQTGCQRNKTTPTLRMAPGTLDL